MWNCITNSILHTTTYSVHNVTIKNFITSYKSSFDFMCLQGRRVCEQDGLQSGRVSRAIRGVGFDGDVAHFLQVLWGKLEIEGIKVFMQVLRQCGLNAIYSIICS